MAIGIDLGTTNTSVFCSSGGDTKPVRFGTRHRVYNDEAVLPTVALRISEENRRRVLRLIGDEVRQGGALIEGESLQALISGAANSIGVPAEELFRKFVATPAHITLQRSPAVRFYPHIKSIIDVFVYNFKRELDGARHASFVWETIYRNPDARVRWNCVPGTRYTEEALEWALGLVFQHVFGLVGSAEGPYVIGLPVEFGQNAIAFYNRVLRRHRGEARPIFVWEPVALYFSNNRAAPSAKALVFDLGGGTLDLAFFEDAKLIGFGGVLRGGAWIDERILTELFSQEQQRQIKAHDCTEDLTLRAGDHPIEIAKINLSRTSEPQQVVGYRIEQGEKIRPFEPTGKLDRPLLYSCYQEAWNLYELAMRRCCNGRVPDIVVMGGGGGMIPWFQEKVQAMFPGAKLFLPKSDVDSVTAIARGLAVIGASDDLVAEFSAEPLVRKRDEERAQQARQRHGQIEQRIRDIDQRLIEIVKVRQSLESERRPVADRLEQLQAEPRLQKELGNNMSLLDSVSQLLAAGRELDVHLRARCQTLSRRLGRLSALLENLKGSLGKEAGVARHFVEQLSEARARLKKAETQLRFLLCGQYHLNPGTKNPEEQRFIAQAMAEAEAQDPRFMEAIQLEEQLAKAHSRSVEIGESIKRCDSLRERVALMFGKLERTLLGNVAKIRSYSGECENLQRVISECQKKLRTLHDDRGCGRGDCQSQLNDFAFRFKKLFEEEERLKSDSQGLREKLKSGGAARDDSRKASGHLESGAGSLSKQEEGGHGGAGLHDFAREIGKFGSYPDYDSMDDESFP